MLIGQKLLSGRKPKTHAMTLNNVNPIRTVDTSWSGVQNLNCLQFNNTGSHLLSCATGQQLRSHYTGATSGRLAYTLPNLGNAGVSLDLTSRVNNGSSVPTFYFADGGTKLFVSLPYSQSASYDPAVLLYHTSPYSFSGASYQGLWDIGSTHFNGMHVNEAGTRIIGSAGNQFIYQRNLSTPFDLSTASSASNSSALLPSGYIGKDLFIDDVGENMFVLAQDPGFVSKVLHLSFGTPWEANTLSVVKTHNLSDFNSDGETWCQGLAMDPLGETMVISGTTLEEIRVYDLR